MYNTGNPVPSNKLEDMADNAQVFDNFVNSSSKTTPNRNGASVKTRAGFEADHNAQMRVFESGFDAQILNMGFTRVGTFATGATITNPRQTLLWDIADSGDGQEYGWSGTFPKVVPPLSTPNTTGGIAVGKWMSRFDPELRVQVRESLRRSYAEDGYNLVAGSFEAGGTLVNANDVLLQERTGKAFSGPAGTVAAGTNPTSGWFVDKSGGLLRHELVTSTFETMQDLLESTGLINNSVVRVLSRDGLGSQGGLFKITDTAPAVIDNFRNVPLFNGCYAVEYLQHPRTNPKLAFSGTKVCAHRGLSQQAPENSIASIAAAHRVGIEFAELDIIPCADGIICLHDDTIDRTTVGVGKIKDLTLAEIQSYDMKPTTVLSPIIQTNFTKYFGGERIPTLQQVLDEAKRTGITLFLESKFFNEEAIRDYYKILEKNKMLDSVIITTSSINNLHIYRTLNPDIPLGLNYLVSTQVTIESLDMLELIQNCWVIADHTVLNKNIVDEALSRGIKVMSYTVNTVAVYQSLADMGVSLAMANWRVA